MTRVVRFPDSKPVPDEVLAEVGPSRYEIDLSGFEQGLQDLAIVSVDRMLITMGADHVDNVSDPVVDLGSETHTVSWTMREQSAGLVTADVWFTLSSDEPIALGWELMIAP